MELKKIDFEREKYFDCGGKKFFINESLGFARYKELQKIMIELGYSATFADIFNNITKAIGEYNKHDYFAMSIILYKINEGVKNTDEKEPAALRLCALFINEENEDLTKYNEAEMKAKIDCWASELEVSPFVNLALGLVPGWMKAYLLVIRDGLSEPEPEES